MATVKIPRSAYLKQGRSMARMKNPRATFSLLQSSARTTRFNRRGKRSLVSGFRRERLRMKHAARASARGGRSYNRDARGRFA